MPRRFSLGTIVLLMVSAVYAEHFGEEFAWMNGLKGKLNQSCCGVMDCTEITVALLSERGMESTVMIGETVLTLPTPWVHPSKGHTGVWCFVPQQPTTSNEPMWYQDAQGRQRVIPPKIPTQENTRCAFYSSSN